MSPLPFTPLSLLHGLVLRLAVMLGGMMGVRCLVLEGRMRARVAAMPDGARRARCERALAHMVRVREVLADPGFFEDARTLGKAAEVARCMGDAGRRALARRFGLLMWRNRGARRIARRAALAAVALLAERCTGFPAVAC